MVKVYTNTNCGKCNMLKRWLKLKSISYSEVNISENESGYNKLIEANRTSLPVIEINDMFVDIEKYDDILNII